MLFVLVLLLLLPLKGILYFFLMTLFELRVRTGFVVGTSLTSYSEFALIAGAAMTGAGLIPDSICEECADLSARLAQPVS